ncbi:flocculation protein FLO11-like [Pollicipes pollicipes]|uniref:flocculation protein FLO11-like n=1 Tax=Pollicipes pollicipes TaxID=41117 RepID=UPI001885793C|nr:flocculation protein FLO11-like [Pollicipes pollicipes]
MYERHNSKLINLDCDYMYPLVCQAPSSTTSTLKPTSITTKPTFSTSEPTSSTSQSTSSTPEPTSSTPQSPTTPEPTSSSSEPTSSTSQSTFSTSEPTSSTPQPSTTSEPTSSSSEPTSSTSQSTSSTPEPTSSTPQPSTTPEPTSSSSEPTSSTSQSTSSTSEPTSSTSEPASSTTAEPLTTSRPTPTTSEPSTPTAKPTPSMPEPTSSTSESTTSTLPPTSSTPSSTHSPAPSSISPTTPAPPTSRTPPSVACPAADGWVDLEAGDSRCYYLSANDPAAEPLAWGAAHLACQIANASLASVPSVIAFYAVAFGVRQTARDAWTGLLNIAGQRSWLDGTAYNHQLDQFFDNKSHTAQITYGYISAEDGLFHLGEDTTPAAYVCYQDMTPPTQPTTTTVTTTAAPTTTAPPCGSTEWVAYNDTCYLFTEDEQYWAVAAHGCHEMDAELVSVHNTGLVTFLLLRAGDAVYWTGLQDENATYVWEDGTPTTDVNDVLADYLDEWEEGKNCVAMDKTKFPEALVHEGLFHLASLCLL